MIILLSNDDGIQSAGLTALEESRAPLGDIYTVAPDRAQSSMSHALTLHRPRQRRQWRQVPGGGSVADGVQGH